LRTRDDCTRSEFDFARLNAGDALYASATGQGHETPTDLWARRSYFRLGDDPLLVYEVFMPAIAQCP
jgi:chorismate--pyruvate lyase